MKQLVVISFLLCTVHLLDAQEVADDIQRIVEDYIADNERAEDQVELLYEDLYDLYEHPLNLNTASAEDLQRLPFLSTFQIKSLLDYRRRFGAFVSLYELQAVYGLDRKQIDQIRPFVTFEDFERLYKGKVYWKHQLLLRSTAVVESQAGYHKPDSLPHYQGAPYSALIKYKGALKKSWSWHLTGDQDRGEAWGTHAPVMDFLSGGLQYEGEGWLKHVILGDYRLCFGEGLLINNNFGYGKSSQVLNISQNRPALRRSTTSSEYGYFRGSALQFSLGTLEVFLGASSRLTDASVDSIGDEVIISSFPQTGFHRTASEVAKYKNQRVEDAVLHLDYSFQNIKVGATITAQRLEHRWQATPRPDNVHMPSYKTMAWGSLNYKWNQRGLILFGELASLENGALAGVQGLQAKPSSRVGLAVLYRYYSKSYYAPYAQAFSEGSTVSNEEGLYMGLNLLIAKGWSLDTYFDLYQFPWLRYGETRPTTGYDFFLQPNYTASRQTSMYWRFKYEDKEEKSNDGTIQEGLESSQRLNFRYHLKSKVSDYLTLQTRVAACYPLHLHSAYGFMLYQDVKGTFFDDRCTLALRYALYNTSSYESRIYTYESDVLYLSYTPALYGRGSRMYLNTSFDLNTHFTLYLKTAYSKSFDGHLYGTALDATDQDRKTDIHLQLRYKF